MRKTPSPDADPAGRPVNTEPAAPGASASADDPRPSADDTAIPTDDNTAPSLVWPPLEDELNDWEVLQLKSTGHTIIEPMKYTPPAGGSEPPAAERRPFTPPPTPAPYVPPEPIDDPAGETSLLPISGDQYLPETELIEPLTIQPTEPVSGHHSGVDAAPDDRTLVIPRPAGVTHRHEHPEPAVLAPASPSLPSHEDTNPGVGTQILVAPAFAASVGHAATVPVSALHRAPRPQPTFGPRHPMEETLPAGVTREMLLSGRTAEESDETVVRPSPGRYPPRPDRATRRAGRSARAVLARAVARPAAGGDGRRARARADFPRGAAARVRPARLRLRIVVGRSVRRAGRLRSGPVSGPGHPRGADSLAAGADLDAHQAAVDECRAPRRAAAGPRRLSAAVDAQHRGGGADARDAVGRIVPGGRGRRDRRDAARQDAAASRADRRRATRSTCRSTAPPGASR